ncbi:MAG: DUF2279 domain-containing protein [Saprospiraceae bacterium]
MKYSSSSTYLTLIKVALFLWLCTGLAGFGESSLFAQFSIANSYRYTANVEASKDWKAPVFLDQHKSYLTKEPSKLGTFLTPAETYNPKRFWVSVGTATTIYTGFAIGLWEAWYKNYELGPFQTFNDQGEWLNMDKFGHGYTAYHYSRWAFQGLNWSGTPRKRAIVMAAGTSLLLQSTVEVMDGFSAKWGFSWSDMAMNSLGAGVFVGQELLWEEQRINFKVSSYRRPHSTEPIASIQPGGPTSSLARRAEDLYGGTPWQRFIKDYNGQTLWVSANPAVLIGKETKHPWINLSFGYSPENIYGGFGNTWSEDGFSYNASTIAPRYRQYILSFDIDFDRVPCKNPIVKTFLHLINHFKIPAPAISYGSESGAVWHWLYY